MVLKMCLVLVFMLNIFQQTGGLCNQLEVILMTCQQSQKVQKQIDEAIMLMNLENVKVYLSIKYVDIKMSVKNH